MHIVILKSRRENFLLPGNILWGDFVEWILVKTVTYAMKGRDVLTARGIPCKIERVPKTKETGCGYALSVRGDILYAENILQQNGVKMYGRVSRTGLNRL